MREREREREGEREREREKERGNDVIIMAPMGAADQCMAMTIVLSH